jgi:hypothetical protein
MFPQLKVVERGVGLKSIIVLHLLAARRDFDARRTSARLAVVCHRLACALKQGGAALDHYPTEMAENRLRTFQVFRTTLLSELLYDSDPHQAIDDVANRSPPEDVSPKARSAWTRSFWSEVRPRTLH